MGSFADAVGMKEATDSEFDQMMAMANGLLKDLSDDSLDFVLTDLILAGAAVDPDARLAKIVVGRPEVATMIAGLACIPLVVEKQVRKKRREASASDSA